MAGIEQFGIIATKPCYSIMEEEQMVEASNLSFYSQQLMIHGQDENVCLWYHKWSQPLKATGSLELWDKLIRQCLQCWAAYKGKGNLQPFGSLLSVSSNDKTNTPCVKVEYIGRDHLWRVHPPLFSSDNLYPIEMGQTLFFFKTFIYSGEVHWGWGCLFQGRLDHNSCAHSLTWKLPSTPAALTAATDQLRLVVL